MKKFLKSYYLIIIMVLAALIVGYLMLSGRLVLDDVINSVRNNKPAALAVLFGLFILKGVALCIPLAVIGIGSALIFGIGPAIIINIVGTALCMTVSYLVGRYSKSLTFEKVIEKYPRFGMYFGNATKYGFSTCFALHALHISTEIQGVLFGLLRMKYPVYILSSVLAVMPSILCYTIIGNDFDFTNPVFWGFLAFDAVTLSTGIYLTKRNIIAGGKKGTKSD